MKIEILNMLLDNKGNFISGEYISDKLGITRAAVWKYIKSIKEEGYEVESSSKKGYKIIGRPEILTYTEIKDFLNTKFIGREVIHYSSVDSTNLKAKEINIKDIKSGTVVVSEEQSSGRGRLGRKWVSPFGKGVWMSIILKPDIDPSNAYKLTVITAAAVYNALKANGIESLIKWPNDILLNGKKICGILTEMSAELNIINNLIIGIGININSKPCDFPEDLISIASSLYIEKNIVFNRKKIMADILNNFELLYESFISSGSIESSIDICKNNSAVLSKDILLVKRNESILVKAIDINSEGYLIVQEGNDIYPVMSGEVSIRSSRGYI
ncbi:biotin--[acetyl-CoA-carboxylase] ligase [Clostridium sp. 19966]|uniref:biotin--[acetyl-CoA-carboxylase] ligase n=1 Tax=Clostridium sp. 19966 TaxID=2768166 RepID=UPI0028E09F24|nr:biotin--[acetyl-CoA-carboxylase] ligase [Clostridium sp. 19966]MDT8718734.1 biotin--[acetyl-CoA-carboxylase] ligase [Clostridium sp. 19966]